MGLFDFIKKKKSDKLTRPNYWNYMNDYYSPVRITAAESDVVIQAIGCIVREMKKLTPLHIVQKAENSKATVNDNIQDVLNNPNPLMTTTDFIELIVWQVYKTYNSFVLPQWDNNNRLIALYPIRPLNVQFLQDQAGTFFVELTLANNIKTTVKYSDLIHIKYNYHSNDFLGGNEFGQPDEQALTDSINLNKSMLDGVEKALKSSFAINGVIKYNSIMDNGKTEEAVKELTEALLNNKSGLMPLDMKGEFIPLTNKPKIVDETTLKFIDEKILRYFGVPRPILTGDYTKQQYEAFFQKTLEPLIVQFNQAFTKTIFTERERVGFGHKIEFGYKLLDFMTMSEKIEYAKLASSVAAITVGELRDLVGYAPYDDDELNNTPIMSKYWGDAGSVKDMNDKDKSE